MHGQAALPVVADRDTRVLILGSFPSRISLERQEYYANPRNAFWRILQAAVGIESNQHYGGRIRDVCDAGLALWDVCAVASRPGSLDTAICSASVVPNDFAGFLRGHPRVERICFNGTTAARLYLRHVHPTLSSAYRGMPVVILPSSSPAHAAMRFEKKVEKWRNAMRAGMNMGTSLRTRTWARD